MSYFADYFKQISQAFAAGNATEHTYRPALQTLLERLAPGVTATNEPKRIKCGAPDYILTRGETPLGYVEAKDIGEPLDKIENSDQLKRYRESLGNLILTDYVEFRWYVGGQRRLSATLGAGGTKVGGVQKPLLAAANGAAEVGKLLEAFFEAQVPTVGSPKELAERMAKLARRVRETILLALLAEDKGGTLHQQFEGFRKVLLHDLTPELFADMYAQTIAYGLFAARCNKKPGERFTRVLAPHQLPKTNPFLRKTFGYIAGPDLDERVDWLVDDLAELLERADMEAILKDFGHRTRQEDPVVHFYETFLAAYDPKMREARGVYYTPEPVVSYIVRSVDHLLKAEFGLRDGLADFSKVTVSTADGPQEVHRVQILDPATGTGTFLHGVVDHIADTYAANKGMWSSYVSQHLLPRLFGFELLVAPYAVAHLKLGLQLAESGYDFQSNERLGIYLTNTLEEGEASAGTLPFANWIAEEANAANAVKQGAPIMVVLGNPPYSGHSANKGKWISNLLHGTDTQTGAATGNYFEVDGKPLGERNPKWLNDDYVKFIRFAQRHIEQTGYGILAFISNHGYLDNPTFRGMRQSLMQTFDDIYVLDLHGNSKKKEQHPDGSEDKNVFDIQQGVAIGFFVKRPGSSGTAAKVRHADLYGPRSQKYATLKEWHIFDTNWTVLSPQLPAYLFVPQDTDLLPEYSQGWSVAEMMPVNNIGMQTHRDYLVTDMELEPLQARMKNLHENKQSDEELRDIYELGTWDIGGARKRLRLDKDWDNHYVNCLWRPFDVRHLYYNKDFIDRPRFQITEPLLQNNVALLAMRQVALHSDYSHFLASKVPCIDRVFYSNKGAASVFPLYLYPSAKQAHLFEAGEDEPQKRKANLAPEFIVDFAAKLGLAYIPDGRGDGQATFGPENIFDYLYAVFHCPTYRSRYAEFLKIDFPRLPLTSQPELFWTLCGLGKELVGLHLMERSSGTKPTYPVALPNDDPAQNAVGKVQYVEPHGSQPGRVYINAVQYFEGVPAAVWAFQVGGYQVCHKWLKDRKGRTLSFDDIQHYQSIVAALGETIRLMNAVEEAIDRHGGWPLT